MNTCKHLAIIMDGNGRWAKAQGKPRTAGHLVGSDNVRTIAIAADEMGIEYLTLYAFSTENWKRTADEVNYIMKLPAFFFKKVYAGVLRQRLPYAYDWRIGYVTKRQHKKVLRDAEEESKDNHGLSLNICMNYGSRREILLAARKYAQDVVNGKATLDIEEEDFDQYMMTKRFPTSRSFNSHKWRTAYFKLFIVADCVCGVRVCARVMARVYTRCIKALFRGISKS